MAHTEFGTMFKTFATWQDVLEAEQDNVPLWYKAPMDVCACRVLVSRAYRLGKRVGQRLRVMPLSRQADPFWADAGHLDRFRHV